MNTIALVQIIQGFQCKVRLKIKNVITPEEWTSGAIIPAPDYIELNGPWPIRDVEWLEINPIIMEHIGRLVAPRRLDSTSQIESALRKAGLFYTVSDGIIRVPFSHAV